MKKFLSQPYPYYYESGRLRKPALTIGMATTLFLYIFRPVGIENGLIHPLIITGLTYGVLAGALFYLYFRFVPQLIPHFFNTDNWTVAREMIAFSGLFLLAGIVNYSLQPLLYKTAEGWNYIVLLQDIKNTFLVGFLVLGVMTATNFAYLLRSQEEKAQLLRMILRPENEKPAQRPDENLANRSVRIEGEHEQFELLLDELLFVRADGNYVEIYRHGMAKPEKELRRIPLKTIEESLPMHGSIIRVHRAYLVQLLAVEEISGNAQGYRLTIKGTDQDVPVSRTYLDTFNRSISSLKRG